MKSKIKDIIAIIFVILIVIAFLTTNPNDTKENTTAKVKTENIVENKEENKEETIVKEEVKEEIKEEKKSNLSNVKGYDLIYAISKYVGKDYNLKTNTNGTTKYDIYIQEKYDIVMNVDSKTDKVLSIMLTTYQDDLPFLKFADELFIDKTPIDEWITNNYKSQEEVKTIFDGYELFIGTDSNGVTELSIAEEGFYD